MKQMGKYFYRIPFSETDAMGIVHHSNHPRYLERARVDFLRLIGMPYTQIMHMGFHFPVTEMSIIYKKPISFDQTILIECGISKLTKIRLNFEYRLFITEELSASSLTDSHHSSPAAASGKTHHCCVNNAGKPMEMPEELYNKLAQYYEEPSQ